MQPSYCFIGYHRAYLQIAHYSYLSNNDKAMRAMTGNRSAFTDFLSYLWTTRPNLSLCTASAQVSKYYSVSFCLYHSILFTIFK